MMARLRSTASGSLRVGDVSPRQAADFEDTGWPSPSFRVRWWATHPTVPAKLRTDPDPRAVLAGERAFQRHRSAVEELERDRAAWLERAAR